jgi:hypothetical protein
MDRINERRGQPSVQHTGANGQRPRARSARGRHRDAAAAPVTGAFSGAGVSAASAWSSGPQLLAAIETLRRGDVLVIAMRIGSDPTCSPSA